MPQKRERKPKDKRPQVVGFLGVGLDNQDGEQRFTRSEHFFLIGGSEETHARMQDRAIRFTANLKERGKRLEETSVEEIVEMFREGED